ncbi:PAS domain S-box protein [bacterium]|nr:PAS domain S-box protein [bacterium]
MTLRGKVSLLLFAMVIGATMVLYLTAREIMLSGFARLERHDVEQSVDRVKSGLLLEAARLDATTADWARWDDTYYFAKNYDMSYVNTNLSPEVITDLGLAGFAVVDTRGHILYITSVIPQADARRRSIQTMRREVLTLMKKPLRYGYNVGQTGYIEDNGSMYLVSSRAIVRSDNSGPITGVLTFFRLMDSKFHTDMSKQTGFPYKLTQITRQCSYARVLESGVPDSDDIMCAFPNDHQAKGYIEFPNAYGVESLVLEVSSPRRAHDQAVRSVKYLIMAVVLFALLFALLSIRLMDKVVIARIINLKKQIGKIDINGELFGRVSESGRDEIFQLACTLNGMLGLLQQVKWQLRSERERFAITLSSIGDAVIATDSDLYITFINKVAQQLTGWSEEDAIGRHATTVLQIVDEHTGEPVDNPMLRSIHSCSVVKINPDTLLISRNGQLIPIDDSAAPICDNDGTLIGAVMVFRDVSERKMIELSLRESQQRLANIIDSLPEATLVIDLEGRVIAWNHAIEQMINVKAEDILGKGNYEYSVVLTQERRPILADLALNANPDVEWHYSELRKNGDKIRGECRVEQPDGRVMYVAATASVLRDSYGNKIGAIESLRDISYIKHTIKALEMTQFAMDHASDPLFWIDSNAHFIYVNDAACRSLGYSKEELLGMSMGDIELGFSQARWPSLWEKIANAGFTNLTTYHKASDGRVFPVDMTLSYHQFGDTTYIFAFARDISERVKAEEDVQQSLSLLKATLESTADGILVVDLTGHVITYSRKFLELWRIPESVVESANDEILVRFVLDQIEDSKEYIAKVAELYADPAMESYDRIYLRNGRVFRRYSCPQYLNGEIVGRVWSFREVTEQAAQERQMEIQRDLGLALSEAVSLADAMDACLDYALKATCLGCGGIYLTDRNTGVVYLVAHRGITKEFAQSVHQFPGDSAFAKAVIISEPVYARFDDWRKTAECDMLVELASVAVVPIRHNDKTIASVVLGSYDLDEIPAQTSIMLESMIGQVGQALARIEAEEAVFQRSTDLQVLVNSMEDMLFVTDLDGVIIQCNAAVSALLGYDDGELAGIGLLDLHPEDIHAQAELKWLDMIVGKSTTSILPLRKKDGTYLPVETRVSAGNWGDIQVIFAISRDVTERKTYEEKLDFQARHDALTGLPNRLTFNETLSKLIDSKRRIESQVGVMFLDLDKFKFVNDTLGHDIGDLLLVQVSERLKQCLRDTDVLCRMGGDEFTVILRMLTETSEARIVADRILSALNKPFNIEGHEFNISISIGVSIYPTDATDFAEIVKKADTAMYKAKELGRDNCQIYSAEMDAGNLERMKLERELRLAIENSELEVHYQPRVDPLSGSLLGAESLLRWNHPAHGMVPPSTFIPLAEESGLVLPMGEYVLRTVCAQLKKWQDAGDPPIQVAVNLSEKHICRIEFLENIEQIVCEYGVDPAQLILEMPGASLAGADTTTLAVVSRLRDKGMQVALDGFGTGPVPIVGLSRMPVDYLIIDSSLIPGSDDNMEDVRVAASIVSTAHNLGLQVIAVGVETREQLDLVNSLMCDIAQGYLISAAVPLQGFEQFVRDGWTCWGDSQHAA